MNPVPDWLCGLLFTKSWRIYLHFRHIQIFAFGLEIFPANVTVISQNCNIFSPGTPRFMPEKPGCILIVGGLPRGAEKLLVGVYKSLLVCFFFCRFAPWHKKSTVKTVPFNLIRFCFLGLECIPLCQRVDSLEVYK